MESFRESEREESVFEPQNPIEEENNLTIERMHGKPVWDPKEAC